MSVAEIRNIGGKINDLLQFHFQSDPEICIEQHNSDMFTLDQTKAAHSKVKSGADFPAYIRDLAALGVQDYTTYVTDGHTEFRGINGTRLEAPPRYAKIPVSTEVDSERLIKEIRIHQQGGSDYFTISRIAGECGVEKWVVDTRALTCTYYDLAGNCVLEEAIPA